MILGERSTRMSTSTNPWGASVTSAAGDPERAVDSNVDFTCYGYSLCGRREHFYMVLNLRISVGVPSKAIRHGVGVFRRPTKTVDFSHNLHVIPCFSCRVGRPCKCRRQVFMGRKRRSKSSGGFSMLPIVGVYPEQSDPVSPKARLPGWVEPRIHETTQKEEQVFERSGGLILAAHDSRGVRKEP